MSQKLKEQIDRMVEDSIRRILPGVMNEILVKTIAGAGVIQESSRMTNEQVRAPVQAVRRQPRSTTLANLLDPEAGADFYQDPRAAMTESIRDEVTPSPMQNMAARIQALPPQFQALAEGTLMDDDGGEMWDNDMGDSVVASAGMGPPLERAAQMAGLDFSRMKKAINITEKKKPSAGAEDRAANAQFERQRIQRMREKLNGGKPVE